MEVDWIWNIWTIPGVWWFPGRDILVTIQFRVFSVRRFGWGRQPPGVLSGSTLILCGRWSVRPRTKDGGNEGEYVRQPGLFRVIWTPALPVFFLSGWVYESLAQGSWFSLQGEKLPASHPERLEVRETVVLLFVQEADIQGPDWGLPGGWGGRGGWSERVDKE